jgi:hypothetical protein
MYRLLQRSPGVGQVTFENYIKGRMVTFAVAEALHHGGTQGMLAIAQVLKNRFDAGWGDWYNIVETAGDYRGTIVDPPKLDPRDLAFRELLRRIDDVYHGVADDSIVNIPGENGTQRSLYYAELHNINRPWFRENVLRDLQDHPRLATVGPLTFFG